MVNLIRPIEEDIEWLEVNGARFDDGTYIMINDDNEKVGVIVTEIQDSNMFIEWFHVLPSFQRNHYGTEAIEALKDRYPDRAIIGNCTPREDSVAFWKSQNAVFEDRAMELIKEGFVAQFSL